MSNLRNVFPGPVVAVSEVAHQSRQPLHNENGKLQFTPASTVASAFENQAASKLGPAIEIANVALQIAEGLGNDGGLRHSR